MSTQTVDIRCALPPQTNFPHYRKDYFQNTSPYTYFKNDFEKNVVPQLLMVQNVRIRSRASFSVSFVIKGALMFQRGMETLLRNIFKPFILKVNSVPFTCLGINWWGLTPPQRNESLGREEQECAF